MILSHDALGCFGADAEHFEKEQKLIMKSPCGMKFSNLPILEFRNHVSQRGGFPQISASFFMRAANSRSFREAARNEVYGLSADMCAYYESNIFRVSLELWLAH